MPRARPRTGAAIDQAYAAITAGAANPYGSATAAGRIFWLMIDWLGARAPITLIVLATLALAAAIALVGI